MREGRSPFPEAGPEMGWVRPVTKPSAIGEGLEMELERGSETNPTSFDFPLCLHHRGTSNNHLHRLERSGCRPAVLPWGVQDGEGGQRRRAR